MTKAKAKRAKRGKATAAKAKSAAPKLYKVLGPNGECIHGGGTRAAFSWSLPVDGNPGAWVEAEGPLEPCNNGLHLTTEPVIWMKSGGRVFEAEVASNEPRLACDAPDKFCVRRARLVRELTGAKLVHLRIFSDGVHVVSGGACFASGSATVKAWGSATVKASDSATVEAWGSATVEAWDSATVICRRGYWFGNALKIGVNDRAIWVDQRGDKTRVVGSSGEWTAPKEARA